MVEVLLMRIGKVGRLPITKGFVTPLNIGSGEKQYSLVTTTLAFGAVRGMGME